MLHQKTIAQLSLGLKNKDFSAVELATHFLDRIDKENAELNAFITICREEAIKSATEADKRIATNSTTPLTGIPIAHKDIFCTKGVLTTCASKILSNFIAPYNATIIEKFNDAGVVMLGKTNMDEFGMGSSNENSYFGPVKNPLDKTRVPGGSSGGSAAAVAAGLAPGATGTDTGGSVRQPAALTGITGIKPTYGRVSRWGLIAYASSLDQAGPMGRTAEDCALLLNAMAGFDEKDSTSIERDVPDYTKTLNDKLDGLKIGMPKEYFIDGLDPDIAKAVEATAKEFEKLGAKISTISLPHSPLSVPAYYVVAPAECSSNLARYDGVRYGVRCENPTDLYDLYTRSRAEGFGAEVKRRIMVGTYTLSTGYYDAYYLKAQKIRHLIRDDFQTAFNDVDLILGPTSPTTAFKLGEKTSDPISMYLSDIYTIAVNLAGLPAISFPAGEVNGLPIGMQLIGNYFDEARLLNAAHRHQCK